MGCALLWARSTRSPSVGRARAAPQSRRTASRSRTSRAVAYGSAVYGFLAVAAVDRRRARRLAASTGRARRSVWPAVCGLARHAAALLHVRRAAVRACLSAFAVALFVKVWLHVRRTWTAGGAFALGLPAALMAMVREQDVFFALGPGASISRWTASAVGGETGGARAAARVARRCRGRRRLAFASAYSPQLFAYNGLNGYPGPSAWSRAR